MKWRWKIIILLTTIAGLIAILPFRAHWQAKHRVQAYKNQLRIRGEKLHIDELVPLSPTNAANGGPELVRVIGSHSFAPYQLLPVAMKYIAPGKARVAWEQPVLPNTEVSNVWPELEEFFQGNLEALAEVRSVLEKRTVYFNLNYSQGFNTLVGHLAPLRKTAQYLSIGILFELHAGHTNIAWKNLQALAALLRNYRGEPLMISQLVRAAMVQIGLAATWEALECDGWSEQQLAELQASWEAASLLGELEFAMSMERAMQEEVFVLGRQSHRDLDGVLNGSSTASASGASELVELGKGLIEDPKEGATAIVNRYPRYWAWKWWGSYEEELSNLQLCQEALEINRKVKLEKAFAPALRQLKEASAGIAKRHQKLQKMLMTGGDGGEIAQRFMLKLASAETQRHMLVTVIALKRYKACHGPYPENLQKLVPEFLSAVPIDLMDGKPMRYRIGTDSTFRLYSVGEDGEDNGGDPTPTNSSSMATRSWWKSRDAVWPMPATAEEVIEDNQKIDAQRNAKPPSRRAKAK